MYVQPLLLELTYLIKLFKLSHACRCGAYIHTYTHKYLQITFIYFYNVILSTQLQYAPAKSMQITFKSPFALCTIHTCMHTYISTYITSELNLALSVFVQRKSERKVNHFHCLYMHAYAHINIFLFMQTYIYTN